MADESSDNRREEKIEALGGLISFSITYGPARSENVVEMITDSSVAEIWRPVINYPGGFVSNLGRVRDWKGIRKARMSESHGYPHVEIPYGGSKFVHLIVAETWLGSCPKGLVVCHFNDNKLDARVLNLRYDTHAANARDRVRNRAQRQDKLGTKGSAE